MIVVVAPPARQGRTGGARQALVAVAQLRLMVLSLLFGAGMLVVIAKLALLALNAPDAQQFLSGETALASLDQMPGEATLQTAALVVPTGVSVAPSVAAPLAPAAQPAQGGQPGTAPVKAVAQASGDIKKLMKKASGQAVAMAETGVLSASTLDDLAKLAKREKLALR